MTLKRNSLSDQIYKQLREDIILGRIPSGQKLTMRELQDYFEVSSTPVREALTRLAQNRFVEYITNQGAKVTELSDQDVLNLLDLCCLYDCYAIQQIMKLTDRRQIVQDLRDAIERQKNYAGSPQKADQEYSYIFNDFHEVLYSYAGNDWLMNNAMQESSLLFLADVKRSSPQFPEDAIDEHQAILDAIIAGDADLAIECMKLHRMHEKHRFGLE